MTDIEKRLHNIEFAFMAYVGLTSELLPPEYQDSVNRMVNDYMESTDSIMEQPDKE